MSPHSVTTRCLSLLEKCKTMEHLKQAHSLLFTVGLGSNTFALSRVLAFCSDPRTGSHSYAYNLFRHIQNPSICIWNTMFKAFLLHSQLAQTINLYREMLRIGTVVYDNYTLPYVLKACARLHSSPHGQAVHVHALKSGIEFDIFVGNSLLAMYVEFRNMESAGKVFDEMPELSLVSWTIMVSGYGKSGEVERARLFFDVAPARDKAVWGAMISGYVQNSCFKEALSLFLDTKEIEPDEAVYVSAVCACAHLGELKLGISIHCRMNHLGLSRAVRSGTALIDMYAKCGDLDSAEKIFREMPIKDTGCWNAMISGLAAHGRGGSALELFDEMEKSTAGPDDVTFIAVFGACSHAGLISDGLRAFERMRRVYGIEPKSEHYGCIVDLLGRAGLLDEAKRVVEIEPSKDESCWRAFLAGCVKYGQGGLAGIGSERLLGQSDCESGSYVLLSNLYAISGESGGAGRVRSLMRSRDVEKVPGCSSVEIHQTI